MKMHLKKGLGSELSTLVVLTAKDKKSGKAAIPKLSKPLTALFESAVQESSLTGDKKETVFFRGCNVEGYKNILFVGLGESDAIDTESFRIAGATIHAALKSLKITSAGIHGEALPKAANARAAAVEGLVEGVELAAYDFRDFKTKKDDKKNKVPELNEISILFATAPAAALQNALKRAEILTECQNFARWLGDNPGNVMTPTRLADEAVKAAKGTGLKVTVWDKARIKKEKFGGLLSVSEGSVQEPRFIIMEYKGAAASKKPFCFVGKGLTFDAGGISIKPSQSMEEMIYDMCGGAAVIATMLALAKMKAKVNAIGLVPSSENLPDGAALKPGDIFFARNGKSVEVFNTDAEGRLILSDALSYASELKPAAIVDAATLTGAILIALGNTHTGVFTRDAKLMRKIQDAADASGELVWPMPLTDFHSDDMKGTHADLCNISNNRLAGSATAAAFLENFVESGIPWAHFDIAGTAWNVSSRFNYHPRKGASGIIVRTFVELAENY